MKEGFCIRRKKNTSRATAEKAKITKGEGHSFDLSIFLACAGGLYCEPQKHPPFSLPFFLPTSNNIIKKNWAMLTKKSCDNCGKGVSFTRGGAARPANSGTLLPCKDSASSRETERQQAGRLKRILLAAPEGNTLDR